MIKETALRSDKKSSLEWIWGKSPDNDAYYSTKLTYFDDQFSLYPEYRFYIGTDPFRDKNSWFFTLEDHPKVIQQESITVAEVPKNAEEETGEFRESVISERNDERISEVNEPEAKEVFDCGCPEDHPDFSLDVVFYETKGEEQVSSERTVKFTDLLKEASEANIIKFIRLTGTDFSFDSGEVRKTDTESVIELKGDPGICANRLKKHLSEGITNPNMKRTAELIYTKDKNGMSYYAAVITVYDGQATYFTEYKIYASSEVRKDESSWFNKL